MNRIGAVSRLLLACALGLAFDRASAVQRECVGYFTIDMPGQFEYALSPSNTLGEPHFSGALSSWGVYGGLRLKDGTEGKLAITQRATDADLQSLLAARNAEPQQKKNELLELVKNLDDDATHAVDPKGEDRKLMAKLAEQVVFYERVPGREAFIWPATDRENVFALLNDHILIGQSLVQGNPQARVDDFLAQFKQRDAYALPPNGDACVPFFRVVGDHTLESIGVGMRLIDRPDIVVTLQEDDAATGAEDPKKVIIDSTQPGRTFVGSVEAKPLDRIRPTHALRIDGREGLGAFAQVRREGALANTADKDLDWAFIGYVPGQAGSKPGQSYDITLKVERFGRFARQPMTEVEFRTLVEKLASGIRRRDGLSTHY
jgi:hypothetical protein